MKSLRYIAVVFSTLTVFAGAQAAQEQSQVLANRAHADVPQPNKAGPQNTEAAPATVKHRVLPLDHGPRAQSTPWLNAQVRQHEAEAEQKSSVAAR